MPRPRANPLYEIGGQWIAREPGRPGLYRYWNDSGAGRTRRTPLGTDDLEIAKVKLAQIVLVGTVKTNDSHLTVVLENYFIDKTDHLVSRQSARNAGRLLLECWGAAFKVRSVSDAEQKRFVKWSLTKNHAISTVARNLGVLAAAFAHARLPATIIYSEGALLSKWPELKPKPARVIFEPTDDDVARLLKTSMPENLRRWILNSMATGGRPEAVLELSPKSRILELGLIDLNPQGRRQNKKFRATVRELPIQSTWLNDWERGVSKPEPAADLPRYCGYASVDSVDTALRRACGKKKANLPFLSVYSFRHRVASVLRASKEPKVTGEQISYQLGHKRPGDRSTRGYGAYEPDYLEEAASALDSWIRRVLTLVETYSHTNSHNLNQQSG